MPRSFNENELQKIKSILMIEGKKLFSTIGLKKTTLDDLVKSAGIAKGSFYKFFPSKEVLYMEIIEQEEIELRTRLHEQHLDGESLNTEKIKSFFLSFISFMDEEPLFMKMFSENAIEQLMLKLPAEKLQEHMSNDEDWSYALIRGWQESGYLPEMKEDVFAALMRGIFVLFTQKKIIGEKCFRESLDFLFDALAEKIVNSRRNK
jgi:AcrR family transcriptional regulator